MDNIPSPDSAVILPTWSRESTPLEAIANSPGLFQTILLKNLSNSLNDFLETFTESEVPERSPDSGIMSEKISQSTDDVLSPTSTTVDSPSQTDKAKPENRPKTDIMSEKGEMSDFDVGQVVWVWLASYPLWSGMIAPAPEQDPDHGKSHYSEVHIKPFFRETFQTKCSQSKTPDSISLPIFRTNGRKIVGQFKSNNSLGR